MTVALAWLIVTAAVVTGVGWGVAQIIRWRDRALAAERRLEKLDPKPWTYPQDRP